MSRTICLPLPHQLKPENFCATRDEQEPDEHIRTLEDWINLWLGCEDDEVFFAAYESLVAQAMELARDILLESDDRIPRVDTDDNMLRNMQDRISPFDSHYIWRTILGLKVNR